MLQEYLENRLLKIIQLYNQKKNNNNVIKQVNENTFNTFPFHLNQNVPEEIYERSTSYMIWKGIVAAKWKCLAHILGIWRIFWWRKSVELVVSMERYK